MKENVIDEICKSPQTIKKAMKSCSQRNYQILTFQGQIKQMQSDFLIRNEKLFKYSDQIMKFSEKLQKEKIMFSQEKEKFYHQYESEKPLLELQLAKLENQQEQQTRRKTKFRKVISRLTKLIIQLKDEESKPKNETYPIPLINFNDPLEIQSKIASKNADIYSRILSLQGTISILDKKIKRTRNSLNHLNQSINNIYSDPCMKICLKDRLKRILNYEQKIQNIDKNLSSVKLLISNANSKSTILQNQLIELFHEQSQFDESNDMNFRFFQSDYSKVLSREEDPWSLASISKSIEFERKLLEQKRKTITWMKNRIEELRQLISEQDFNQYTYEDPLNEFDHIQFENLEEKYYSIKEKILKQYQQAADLHAKNGFNNNYPKITEIEEEKITRMNINDTILLHINDVQCQTKMLRIKIEEQLQRNNVLNADIMKFQNDIELEKSQIPFLKFDKIHKRYEILDSKCTSIENLEQRLFSSQRQNRVHSMLLERKKKYYENSSNQSKNQFELVNGSPQKHGKSSLQLLIKMLIIIQQQVSYWKNNQGSLEKWDKKLDSLLL